jgi:hypothetical protein
VTEGNRMAMILAMGDDHSYPKITEKEKTSTNLHGKGRETVHQARSSLVRLEVSRHPANMSNKQNLHM